MLVELYPPTYRNGPLRFETSHHFVFIIIKPNIISLTRVTSPLPTHLYCPHKCPQFSLYPTHPSFPHPAPTIAFEALFVLAKNLLSQEAAAEPQSHCSSSLLHLATLIIASTHLKLFPDTSPKPFSICSQNETVARGRVEEANLCC